jgi:anti-sigma regulatory factor (Ser/Thr protein kinase)
VELSGHGNTIVLAARPDSVRAARKTLARDLSQRSVDSESTFNVLLVASELITNAIEHGSRPGDDVELAWAIGPNQVQIIVRDNARPGRAPIALTSDSERPNGRGLHLVERLASWNEQIVNGRREVAAEVSIAGG